MSEYLSKTVTVPVDMPLSERISEVSKEVAEWVESLDEPFDLSEDVIYLVKCERTATHYKYHYVIDRAVKGPEKNVA